MSEATESPDTPDSDLEPQDGEAAPKQFDADYVNKLRREAARYRAEAKGNAEAVKRLAELEDASKTEAEKTADRLAKADAELASVPAKVAAILREHLIDMHDFDPDDAALFLTADDPDLLRKQAARLVASGATKTANHVPREGASPAAPPSSPEAAFAQQLFTG
jgi:hypothetical protein